MSGRQILENHIKSGKFSHGYLLSGNAQASRNSAFEASRILLTYDVGSITDIVSRLETHPDFFYQQYDSFGIDDSRELIYKASQRPFLGENKVFIIEALSFTVESANALLKLTEEPFSGTYFFIIVPSKDIVIPTLRSRLVVVENKIQELEPGKEKIKKTAEEFLAGMPRQRMETAEKISKDKQKAIEFLNVLEVVIHNELAPLEVRNKVSAIPTFRRDLLLTGLEEIEKSRSLLATRFGSSKMILERLALILPRM